MKISKGFMVLMVCIMGLLLGATTALWLDRPDTSRDDRISKLEKELKEYRTEEVKVEERKEELKKLPDPEILLEQIQSEGTIVSYKSRASYSDYIEEKTLLGKRKLFLELQYKFGISMDMQYIEIVNVEDKGKPYGIQVDVKIPRDKLQIEYIELQAAESKLDDDTSLFATKFKAEDYKEVLSLADNSIKDSIINTPEIWNMAYENIKLEVNRLLTNIDESSEEINFNVVHFVE